MNKGAPYPDLKLHSMTISPVDVELYVPPLTWKGDPLGHIGYNDVFFWVLSGECYLMIENSCYIVKEGQLAFLPKGVRRSYTHISENFSMYEMSFDAKINGQNIFVSFGLTETDHVVTIDDREYVSKLFENSFRRELKKNPLYDMGWCGNIISIINIFIAQRMKQMGKSEGFSDVLKYMNKNISKSITIDELASIVYMQKTYFIKKFKSVFGMPPMAYFANLRAYKAMSLLSATDYSLEQIAAEVGILDKAYFSRFFKKHCGTTPSEYRSLFRQ